MAEIGFHDPGDVYVNRGYTIEFYHVPSGAVVDFKAYLTAYSDSFTSNWESDTVYGRGDPIQTFQNTQRKISLGWVIPANSVSDAQLNLEKCSILARMTYPGYASFESKSSALGLSKAPLMKLKLANLIQGGDQGGLLGAVSGFTFSPNLEMGFFDPNQEQGNLLLPKEINVSCEFNVLHQHSLGWSDGFWNGNTSFPYGLEAGQTGGSAADDIAADESITEADAEASANEVLRGT